MRLVFERDKAVLPVEGCGRVVDGINQSGINAKIFRECDNSSKRVSQQARPQMPSLEFFGNGETPDEHNGNRVTGQFSPEVVRHRFKRDRASHDCVVAVNGTRAGGDGNVGLSETPLFILAGQLLDEIIERGDAA